ncbi:MAG TPA: class I SAM-dependent methyltransferase [Nocardioidaceae bacterium]|nr:class I SAM-dependent methyltransferase [Nocardioidaceae bacterium]
MNVPEPEEQARRFAGESLAAADPTGWFERLYSAAAEGGAVVPWDRGHAHPLLLEWGEATRPDGRGQRALVVGCGLGDDTELLAGFGYDTVGFDISETAIHTARSRYPDSDVDYLTADLLDPPADWTEAYDLVVESQTVQSLPPDAHLAAIAQVGRFVAPGGRLMVIALGAGESFEGPPWPLRRDEIDAFAGAELSVVRIEELPHPDNPGLGRWRAEFRRDA